jgi:hypothetical protein
MPKTGPMITSQSTVMISRFPSRKITPAATNKIPVMIDSQKRILEVLIRTSYIRTLKKFNSQDIL